MTKHFYTEVAHMFDTLKSVKCDYCHHEAQACEDNVDSTCPWCEEGKMREIES